MRKSNVIRNIQHAVCSRVDNVNALQDRVSQLWQTDHPIVHYEAAVSNAESVSFIESVLFN